MNIVMYDGIIVVITCKKNLSTRVKKYKLKKYYNNWIVIYILGDTHQKENTIYKNYIDTENDIDINLLTVKCEDSYVHLIKKFVFGCNYLYDNYIIREGIIHINDDIILNDNIYEFLDSKKENYMGYNPYIKPGVYLFNNNIVSYNTHMLKYINNNRDEHHNPDNNMSNINFNEYTTIPDTYGAPGFFIYLSNYACKFIMDDLKKIDYNIFTKDINTNSSPYIIDDVAISYIMYNHKIPFFNTNYLFDDYDNKKMFILY